MIPKTEVIRRVQTAMLRAVVESPTGLASMDDARRFGLIPESVTTPQWIGAAVAGLVAQGLIVERDVERSQRESRHRSKQGVFAATDRATLRQRLKSWRSGDDSRKSQRLLFDGNGDGV